MAIKTAKKKKAIAPHVRWMIRREGGRAVNPWWLLFIVPASLACGAAFPAFWLIVVTSEWGP